VNIFSTVIIRGTTRIQIPASQFPVTPPDYCVRQNGNMCVWYSVQLCFTFAHLRLLLLVWLFSSVYC